jgi:hypothetical protein
MHCIFSAKLENMWCVSVWLNKSKESTKWKWGTTENNVSLSSYTIFIIKVTCFSCQYLLYGSGNNWNQRYINNWMIL